MIRVWQEDRKCLTLKPAQNVSSGDLSKKKRASGFTNTISCMRTRKRGTLNFASLIARLMLLAKRNRNRVRMAFVLNIKDSFGVSDSKICEL
jgi:hypothetical protein